ncbi:MAG: hypothetical protein ACPGVU_02950 [Limisphaerales bacterium]
MNLSEIDRLNLLHSRRQFFGRTATGLGGAALASMLQREAAAASGGVLPDFHVAPKAKRSIWLFMSGAPSQLDTSFAAPDHSEPNEEDKARLKKAQEMAQGFQALAVKTFKDGTVELKFKVTGWQDEPLVHRLKKVDGKWCLFGSTRTARW